MVLGREVRDSIQSTWALRASLLSHRLHATPDQRSSSMLDELAPSLSYPSPPHQHRLRIVDGLSRYTVCFNRRTEVGFQIILRNDASMK